MKSIIHCFRYLLAIATLTSLCLVLVHPIPASAELMTSVRSGSNLQFSFMYLLSDFSGVVPSQWARVDYDQTHDEIFTLNLATHEIQVFNKEGMEIFAFGGDGEIATLNDIAVGDDGTIYGLSQKFKENAIHVFNYRGKLQEVIPLQGFPEQLVYFRARRMQFQEDRFYLLDPQTMTIVITSSNGQFERMLDVGAKLQALQKEKDPEAEELLGLDIRNFNLDAKGNIYFTVPQLFAVFRLNTDGTLHSFGKSGSGPGKFGVISGIAIDHRGIIYVSDRLRSVVMLFDKNFKFQGEFGYRGGLPEDLLVPDDIAIDQLAGRVFVSQAANKGVGVYRVYRRKKR